MTPFQSHVFAALPETGETTAGDIARALRGWVGSRRVVTQAVRQALDALVMVDRVVGEKRGDRVFWRRVP